MTMFNKLLIKLSNARHAVKAWWHMNNPLREGTRMTGVLSMKLIGEDGKVKDERILRNIIVDDGFDFACDALGKSAGRPPVMEYIAIGDSATTETVSDATLGNELDRKLSTYAHTSGIGSKVYTHTVTFDPGEGTGSVVESGMFNDAVAGDMFNRRTFGIITKGASDSLQVTWQFTLS